MYLRVENGNKFEKIQILFGADCTIQLTIWCLWYFTKIHMVNFYYKNFFTVHCFFLYTQPDVTETIKAVQQAVQIIGPHINDRAWIKIKKE